MVEVTIECSQCSDTLTFEIQEDGGNRHFLNANDGNLKLMSHMIFLDLKPKIICAFKKAPSKIREYLWTKYHGIGILCPECHKKESIEYNLRKIQEHQAEIKKHEDNIEIIKGKLKCLK
jgi:hypothetical protein